MYFNWNSSSCLIFPYKKVLPFQAQGGCWQSGLAPKQGNMVNHSKVHFVIPPIFLKNVEIFASLEAFRYIRFVCKMFVNSFA